MSIVRIQTYNILSEEMSNYDYFIHHKKEYLNAEERTKNICNNIINHEKIIDSDNNNYNTYSIYCLQEVHRTQFFIIHQLLSKYLFQFHYNYYGSGMGVMILWRISGEININNINNNDDEDVLYQPPIITGKKKSFIYTSPLKNENIQTHSYLYDPIRRNCAIGVTFSFGTVWTCHLPCMYNIKDNEIIRKSFIEQIMNQIISISSNNNIILTGDLNSSKNSPTYLYLSSIMKSAYNEYYKNEPSYTNIFTGNDGKSTKGLCDYIFITDKINIKSVEKCDEIPEGGDIIIPNEYYYSDHFPITCILEINN